MLLTPRPDNYSNLNNNTNMNLSPRHRHRQDHANSSSLSFQLTGQLLPNATKCSPRHGQKVKLPPHITICPPDSMDSQGMKSRFLDDDELDNDVFQSPTRVSSPTLHSSSNSPYSDEKHEVHSGRLYLIRHTGSSSSSSSPSGSPSRSPSKSPVSSFPFRPTSPMTTQRWASQTPSSPTSSPSNRKMSVMVRVYRCNTEHFAIISRDALYTSKPVYVNMKHCRVIPGDCLGRFIVAGKCDSGNVIEFETPDLSCLEQWLDAFQTLTPPSSPSRVMGGGGGGSGCSGGGASGTPPIPRSPALPTLTETDEEN